MVPEETKPNRYCLEILLNSIAVDIDWFVYFCLDFQFFYKLGGDSSDQSVRRDVLGDD